MDKQVLEKVDHFGVRGKRILIVSSIDISLLRFRGKLIELLVKNGCEVFLVAPSYSLQTKNKLMQLGAVTLTVPMSRSGLSLVKDWSTYAGLKSVILENMIDLVFPYTIKPVMYASLAGRRLHVPVVGLVNGLGYVFTANSTRQRLLRRVIVPAYRYCVAKNKAMLFQNIDDQEYYLQNRLLNEGIQTSVVDGSGVDLNEFQWREPRGAFNVRFCFVGRLLVEKGIQHFVEAAAQLKRSWPEAEFHVYGEIQPDSKNSITMAELAPAIEAGTICFHGRVENIGFELGKMDVIVSPSWYREGVPRSLLEALSVGLVIIATDMPGCRETIVEGINGFFVTPRDTESLITTMVKVLEQRDKVESMSKASRRLAEKRFDVHKVNAEIVTTLEFYCKGSC